jgi:tRNA U38,U39,U40 pseudouridine synthase TruA
LLHLARTLQVSRWFNCFCPPALQVKNFRREVLSAAIEPAAVCCPGMNVVALRIKGTAFLWHQV